ncbi:hypothetical protein Trydic_g20472 [Trypoxylus dichotomus]
MKRILKRGQVRRQGFSMLLPVQLAINGQYKKSSGLASAKISTPLLEESSSHMQPSATASIPPPGEMDIQAMQSMDWLFKKERIYLLAQFWQQVPPRDPTATTAGVLKHRARAGGLRIPLYEEQATYRLVVAAGF